MLKKTLEQYKIEFNEIVTEQAFAKTQNQDVLFKLEQLAKDCIGDYPNDRLGCKIYAQFFSAPQRDAHRWIHNFESFISEIKDSNVHETTLKEALIKNPSLLDQYKIWFFATGGGLYDYSPAFFSIGKAYVESTVNLHEASRYFQKSIDAGHTYTEFIDILNPPVDKVSVGEFLCIKELEIENLKDKKEIYFLGENGVGKTVLLQAILLDLIINDSNDNIHSFKKAYKQPSKNGVVNNVELSITGSNNDYRTYVNTFAYGTSRFRTGLTKNDFFDKTGYDTLFDRNKLLTDVEWWLKDVQRKELLGKSSIPLAQIKTMLEIVVDFGNTSDLKIEYDENEDQFIFIEKGSVTKFEHLADGYRSVLIWLCDLLRRLIENQPYITDLKDFYGIVLVDEIDMFLHPKWEYNIVRKLRETLPNIQWFFTTHSPVLILGASDDAVFYKLYKENGETKISEQWKCSEIDHLMANAIITSSLFDLETAQMHSHSNSEKELDRNNLFYETRLAKKVKERIKVAKTDKIYLSPNEMDEIIDKAIDELFEGEDDDANR